jgi:hypothetical protein
MARYPQKSNSHGSLRDLQIIINEKKKFLDDEISKVTGKQMNIDWKSPLMADNYAEYRDKDFLERLGIEHKKLEYHLNDFWPTNGPQWDALGVNGDEIILVEAKANIPEMVSKGTGANSIQSIKKIRESLNEVKKYLNISGTIDWSGTFYQYTNRVSHLYYMREKNKIKTNLLFIYFINDVTVDGPKTKDEWLGAIKTMECYLGLNKKHKLRKYIIDIFINVNDLRYKNVTEQFF